MSLIDDYAVVESPIVGTAGFVEIKINSKSSSKTLKIVRETISIHQGCPVNKNVPTKMTRRSFKRACATFRAEAIHCSAGKGVYKNRHSQLTGGGFINTHHRKCCECLIGEAIEKGAPYEAPPNIEFVTRFKKIST